MRHTLLAINLIRSEENEREKKTTICEIIISKQRHKYYSDGYVCRNKLKRMSLLYEIIDVEKDVSIIYVHEFRCKTMCLIKVLALLMLGCFRCRSLSFSSIFRWKKAKFQNKTHLPCVDFSNQKKIKHLSWLRESYCKIIFTQPKMAIRFSSLTKKKCIQCFWYHLSVLSENFESIKRYFISVYQFVVVVVIAFFVWFCCWWHIHMNHLKSFSEQNDIRMNNVSIFAKSL